MTTQVPKPAAILYVSYDGMLEPLGQSQVLAYLERLARDYSIHLVSFEKKKERSDRERLRSLRVRLERMGIHWEPLRYHKTPTLLATSFDVAVGVLVSLWIAIRYRVSIVHARSYVPALVALVVKRMTSAKFLFDMRGFWADERVDGGLWPAGGGLYRITKLLERKFLQSADHVITLTEASVGVLARLSYLKGRMPPVTVIPTCADLNLFRPSNKYVRQEFTFGYVGSVGTWYLFDEVLACFQLIAERIPAARLLIVNRNEHDSIRSALARAHIPVGCYEIVSVEHKAVPAMISRMTVGAAIIKPVYSKIASAPTKLAEYLGCGVPCLGNINVGDMEKILDGERVGVALRNFGSAGRVEAIDRLFELLQDPKLSRRCIETAHKYFSLEIGVDRYRTTYASLMQEKTSDSKTLGV